MLKVGDPAPDIQLHTDTDEDFRLSQMKGKRVVLYFYPMAELQNALGAVVSPDKPSAQAKFKEKYDLPFTLLADENKAAAEAYGVFKEKNMYGKKVMGIERTTFIIGPDGKIEKIYNKVKAKGHAADVLEGL